MKTVMMALLILLGSSPLWAAEGAHASAGIPEVVLWQFLNLAILFSALFYLLKDKVVQSFADRRAAFLSEAEKSKAAQAEAERGYLEIKNKFIALDTSAEDSINRAKVEAQDLKRKMISEAQATAVKIKEDALRSVQVEAAKAQRRLHDSVVAEAVEAARKILSKDIGSTDHQKLQSDFAKNIQVVNP